MTHIRRKFVDVHRSQGSAIAEEALGQAVRRAEAEAWARDNADALAERRAHVDRQGLALDRHRLWQAE